MAKSNAVWGIELGQSALKALRCRPIEDDPVRLEADAFDYIEYPQLLSEPGADAASLALNAIEQFLDRNDVLEDRVAIAVAGHKALSKFVKLPPVESSKIPDMVKYEAKQQIPFPLEEVIWDYQAMAGGSVEDGFALETEVGLFAMKRDEVFRQLRPYQEAEVEVDLVQLSPVSLFNFVVYDQMRNLPPEDQFDPENPPESIVLLSMGCESSELVVSNGFRMWQRNLPIGGNHFTKALMKEFNLTFPKAEHLKRNATTSSAPKQVFQAMRPVFSELVTEMQKSLGFYSNLNKHAKIGRIIGLGGVMKLPGIRTYLEQNLGHKVVRLEGFNTLTGPAVVGSPQFREHILSFAACYGLCLQELHDVRLQTNLIPREIITDRLVAAKKPWTVAAAAVLLLGMSVNTAGHWMSWNYVHPEGEFQSPKATATSVVSTVTNNKSEFETKFNELLDVRDLGDELVSFTAGREDWIQLHQAVRLCTPRQPMDPKVDANNREQWWAAMQRRNQVYLRRIEVEWCDDLTAWYEYAKKRNRGEFEEADRGGAGFPGEGMGGPGMGPGMGGPGMGPGMAPAMPGVPGDPNDPNAQASDEPKPTGGGWIVRLTGHHFRHTKGSEGLDYLRRTMIRYLSQPAIKVGDRLVPIGDVGIAFPMLTHWTIKPDHNPERPYEPYPYSGEQTSGRFPGAEGGFPDSEGPGGFPGAEGGFPGGQGGFPGAEGGFPGGQGGFPGGTVPRGEARKPIKMPRFDFQLQFVWQPPQDEAPAKQPASEGTVTQPGTGVAATGNSSQPAGG